MTGPWVDRFFAEDDDVAEAAWEEVSPEGGLTPGSADAVTALLAALAQGSPEDARALWLIATMATGKPPRLAEHVRDAAQAGRDTYVRLLRADDPEVREAATAALVASGVADADPLTQLALDTEAGVRRAAAFALGIVAARVALLERLLEDGEPSVRYAAALALQRLARIDRRVVRMIVEGAVSAEASEPARVAPWDELYPTAEEAVARLDREAVEAEVPYLLERLAGNDGDALGAAELLLHLAFGEPPTRAPRKPPDELTDLQRRVLEGLVVDPEPWKRRGRMEELLSAYGLVGKRRELGRWLRSG